MVPNRSREGEPEHDQVAESGKVLAQHGTTRFEVIAAVKEFFEMFRT
jgi:hypothetical protein